MDDSLLPPYFRRFRRLYSCELQLMSFLAELQPQTGSRHLAEKIGGYIALCRERRNALEELAIHHPVSAAGDPCSEMSRMIRKQRVALYGDRATYLQGEFVTDICETVHCKLIQDYSLARSFASKLKLEGDADCFDRLVNQLIDEFPTLWARLDSQPLEAVA